jgi:hypothetical protein
MSWASARCDEMGSQYPGNGAMVDSRLVFGPSNPNALVRKLIVPLSQYKSQTAASFMR